MSETAFGYTVETGTDAELLILYRACLARIAVNQSYSIRGRMFTMANLPEVQNMVTWLEGRVNGSNAPADNLARMRRVT